MGLVEWEHRNGGLLAGGSVHFPTPPVSHLEEDSAVAQLRVAFAS